MAARLLRSPYLLAVVLALLLGAAWSAADWADLSARRLPDTDDAMRLAQIRDWIAGQRLGDLSQHRLANGLALHWSRIGDLVPAAIILALRPFFGTAPAEIAAVVAWPLVQFAALLGAVATTARRVAPAAVVPATLLAALAYPATSLFLPGRIDHHALQLLLVLVQLNALLAPRSLASGAVAGAAVAAGAAIGLETLPFALLTTAVVALSAMSERDPRQTGFGLALAGGLALLLPLAGRGGVCDTVEPLAPVIIAGGLVLAALGWIERGKPALAIAAAIALAILAWPAARPCLAGPYASVDPLAARLWLSHVTEAQPLLAAPLAQAVSYAGLAIAGMMAGAVLAWRRRAGWPLVVAYQLCSVALALSQLRGIYLAAILAVVPFAAMIVALRARSTIAVLCGWIAGCGLTYPLAVGAFGDKQAVAATPSAASCTSPAALARIAALPPGRVMAGVDLGAYLIAGTRHSVVAAPYHRGGAGIADAYRFLMSPPDAAHAVARRWRVDYVILCPGDLGPLAPPRGSIGGGERPDWMHPIGDPDDVPSVFRVDRGLSAGGAAR
jgi:hypothetical protein